MTVAVQKQLYNDLENRIQADILTDSLRLALYSSDASIYQIKPLAVILPRTTEDVITIVQYAAENRLSIIPRGGGSGLGGESIGSGIILDFSRYMNQILSFNRESSQVTVQPGVVLDDLNRWLAGFKKKIGPDPASGNRATLGGMIGNNSTGAHSMVYGFIGNHLDSVKAVTAAGQLVRITRNESPDNRSDVVGWWAGQIHDMLHDNRQIIEQAKPRTDRNSSGYNIYPILQNGAVNLAELLAGSEGTLAVVTQAALNLVDLPPCKALLQINYDSLVKMARAIPRILELRPSACELMDGALLAMARQAYPDFHDVLPDGIEASLLVEFDGSDESAVSEKIRLAKLFVEQLPSDCRGLSTAEIYDPARQSRVMAARKAAVPLLYRQKSAFQPIPVVEDIAVPVDRLAEYIENLQDITRRLNVPMAYYAHAGHGALHTRPFLDLHDPGDRKKMCRLADEIFRMVWRLGGTISSEHGEGLVRASFIKGQYGPEVYEIFRRIKHTFDPEGILNPGKIINDDPDILTKNLRFSNPLLRANHPTSLIFRPDELVREIEQCNGNGLCRSIDPTLSMCPIFRATGDEQASPRAKANLMRHWLYGLLDEDILQTDEFKQIADLCVNCKMCALECPSLVNIPKLMIEARAEYVRHHGLTRAQFLLTRGEFMSRTGSAFAPFANAFLQMGWFRRLMQLATGLDRRRPFPRFQFGSGVGKLRRYLASLPPVEKPIDKVAYFVDLYATWNDHQLGRAVVDVLRHNRIEVIIPDQQGMVLPAISYGDLPFARRAVQNTAKQLAAAVRQGCKILCSEPTAALCLKDEYLDVLDTEDVRLVSQNTWELTDYLLRLHTDGHLQRDFRPLNLTFAYHAPCHLQALHVENASKTLLSAIEGVKIQTLPNSCCGIAGTFGFQKKNFDLSLKAGRPMLDPLRQSAADFGLTECSTCKMQMELAANKKTVHPIKVLACAYGLPGETADEFRRNVT